MDSTKEKAKELIEKFIEPTKVPNIKHIWVEDIDAAKQCALIAVEEILNIDNVKPYILHKEIINYYTKVKEEIENL